MESYPNPYSAVTASFNHQSPAKVQIEDGGDEDDPQNIPDDDLLLWANAQFTFDNQSSNKDLEDEIALRIAHKKQQEYLAAQRQARGEPQNQQQNQNQNSTMQPLPRQLQQQQHQQQLQQQQQLLQQQYQQQHPHQSSHASLYHTADVQQQLQQFDAIHGYLDASSEDPRTSLSLVERSRQRNPVSSSVLLQQQQQQLQQQQQQQQNIQFDPRTHHPAFSTQLGQPLLGHQHQSSQPYPTGDSPIPSSSPIHEYQQFQFNAQQQHQQHSRDHNNVGASLSSLSLSSPNGNSSLYASAPASHEEKLEKIHRLENELRELDEERRQLEQDDDPASPNYMDTDDPFAEGSGGTSDSRSRSNSVLSPDDPDYAIRHAAAEEDKRRRNTAASARFRQKKRLREQILEKTAKEMTEKSEILELRVKELEMEIKWLRGLVVEKDASRALFQDPGNIVVGGGKVGARSSSSVFGPSSFPNSFALAVSPPIHFNQNQLISDSGKASSRRNKKP
ncbi:hypothetical protein BGZ76_010852 [Entomortierella beljakovae]|nr:hypothetical protein BGZ76_010852 [Entomortierella beljakovae]